MGFTATDAGGGQDIECLKKIDRFLINEGIKGYGEKVKEWS